MAQSASFVKSQGAQLFAMPLGARVYARLHSQGRVAITQHVALVYAVMLGVALAAERYGRPDLRLSRKGVLAVKTL